MSLLGASQMEGARLINSVGNIEVGNENINGIFSNLTLLSLLITTLRGNVVRGRSSFDGEYDYIIIGSGTAGSIMASRLSQHPCARVLVLEAGGEQPILSDVPGFARILLGTEIDWSYKTAPQKDSSFGQKENRVLWNSGKVLGGSSVINAMLYVRGNKENFNEWARNGATGWSYDEVFPYFLKLEDNHNLYEVDPGFHRKGGPMGAEKSRFYSPVRVQATKALLDLGYPLTDINGRSQFGVYDLQGTIRHQERCSTARAYLKPTGRRHNLHIVTRAFVRKILINKNNGNRAFGVVFEHNNKIHIVRIKNSDYIKGGYGEIIVANGATRTPQLLMLSGIGPKEHLQSFGIPVIADLPVGKNLMDHYAAGMLYTINPKLRNAVVQQISPDSVAEYVFTRTGSLTSISQVNVMAFLDGVNNTKPDRDFPQQQLYFLDYSTEDAVKTMNLNIELQRKVYTPYLLSPVMLCFAQLLQPESRGEILLNSIDPHEFPHIDPKYYSNKKDIENNVIGMKLCNQVANNRFMQEINTQWVDTQRTGHPGCEHLEGNEDDYLGCLAQSVVLTIWHPVGTAKMGNSSDPTAVVNPELKVFGVKNLRVVNAAIMPKITSGNTNVPTMMIAEKAYDMIKDAIMCPIKWTIHGAHEVHVRN